MARTRDEWIGETDDQRAPKRVRDRIFDREGGKCHLCDQPIVGKKWALDHVKALINGGENREKNLKPIHIACHRDKTAADVAEKARIAAKRQKHRRIVDPPKMRGAPFPTTSKAAKRSPRPPVPNNSQLYRAWKAANAGEPVNG